MPKFLIKWNAGFGENSTIMDCVDIHGANSEAYMMWQDEVELTAYYEAVPYTKEIAEELGIDWDEEDEE